MDEQLKVMIGSGGSRHNQGWLHTEESELNLLNEEEWANRFKKSSIKAILAEHVWEHLTYEEWVQAEGLSTVPGASTTAIQREG